MSAHAASARSRSASRRLLAPLALAQFVCSFAGSNMHVMIDDISRDLDTTVKGVQTAITLFLLIMAILMIRGSKLTDRWGRKRCFTAGLTIYGVGALVSAASPGLGVLVLGYSVVITHDDDGRIRPVLDAWQVGFAGGVGVIAGGLIGALLVGPLLGMVLGGALAAGAANKMFGSEGIPEQFVNELRENLAPGTAAMIVLVREMHPDQILPNLHEPGHTIHTTLGNELEAQLDAALTAAKHES